MGTEGQRLIRIECSTRTFRTAGEQTEYEGEALHSSNIYEIENGEYQTMNQQISLGVKWIGVVIRNRNQILKPSIQ